MYSEELEEDRDVSNTTHRGEEVEVRADHAASRVCQRPIPKSEHLSTKQGWLKGERYGFPRSLKVHQTWSPTECDGRALRDNYFLTMTTAMSAIVATKAHFPLLAFLSTSLLLFFAYSGTERRHDARYRYPDIPPPGASDGDRLRYSKCLSLRLHHFGSRTPHSHEPT